jgi:protein SCO1/2
MDLLLDEAPADEHGEPPPHAERSLRRRDVAALLALVAVAGLIAALVTPSGSPKLALAGNVTSSRTSRFAGATLSPVKPAPSLSLRNYRGERVNLAQFRGRAVFVTFLYTNCPDVCPIIASNLRIAQRLMGPAEAARVEMVAVSVDPRGDTPRAVAAFLARHGMTGRMQYLIGSALELARVWRAWNVGSVRDAQQPQFVDHSGLVYGVSASGRLMTVYPANFSPVSIARDAVRLAGV